MKRTTNFLALALLILVSCNDSGTADYNQDTSINVRVDSGRGDTANYERMSDKTNSADTTGGKNLSNPNDTANYERMQDKKRKDSTNY